MADLASIGVIGGSGLYEFLDAADEVTVETPFGPPSDPLVIGEVAGRRVAFVPRHGRDHRFPPHRIPYRANLWALRSVGVRQILAPSAVGSLTPSYGPGTLVVPDQLVDRTTGRSQTFYDEGGAVHIQFADPYCPVGRARALAAAREAGWSPPASGTLVVIEGPRFSTRAESQWYAAQGWTLIGMTGLPEAVLARELALCYTTHRPGHRHRRGSRGGRGRHPGGSAPGVRREHGAAARAAHEGHRGPARGAGLPLPARARRPAPAIQTALTATLDLAGPPSG